MTTAQVMSFNDAGAQGTRRTRKRQVIKGVPRIASTHDKQTFWLFEHLTVEVAAGEVLAMVSRDPDRASAAVRVWAGLLPLDAGTMEKPERSMLVAPPPARWVRELSVEQSIRMLAGSYGLDDDEIDDILPAVARTAQVSSSMNQPIEDQGKQMRSQIAFAVGVNAPVPVVMFDHTASVGTPSFRGLCPQLIAGLKDLGKTVVITTTRPQVVLESATRGLIMRPHRCEQVEVAAAAEFLLRARAKGRRRARRELFDDEDDSGLEF